MVSSVATRVDDVLVEHVTCEKESDYAADNDELTLHRLQHGMCSESGANEFKRGCVNF